MNRAVYIGGFAGGHATALNVGEAIDEWGVFDDVEIFTFSEAMHKPHDVNKAVKNAFCITHSAGIMPVVGASPERLVAFAPPVPSRVRNLVKQTLPKMIRMHTVGMKDCEDRGNIFMYVGSTIAESVRHPWRNFRSLGKIAQFDSIQTGINAQHAGIPTQLIWSPEDDYFSPDRAEIARARDAGVTVVYGRAAGKLHDELLVNPHTQLTNIHGAFVSS
jgi:hypothetical protein